jgi:hypothetical protein
MLTKRLILVLTLILLFQGVNGAFGISIYGIQYNADNRGSPGITCYPSPECRNRVAVTGVVTGVDPNDPGNFYLQDADSLWSGIFVYYSGQAVSCGDSVSFTGMVSEENLDFDGYTRLEDIISFRLLKSGAAVFDPITITSGQLSGSCSYRAEAYEGMLVRINNVVITGGVDADGRWLVDDGSGDVYIGNDYFRFNPVIDESLTSITGVVSGFNDNTNMMYIILPRDADDLVITSNRGPGISNAALTPSYPIGLEEMGGSPQGPVEGTAAASLRIPPKVLIPGCGEQVPITYNAPVNSDLLIQIYDIEGNLVATLMDAQYDPTRSELAWDGRDRLEEIVPLGVYICYAEATERLSGRVTTARAPIVVAVPLK